MTGGYDVIIVGGGSAGYPDFAMPQRLRAESGRSRVTISRQVSDIDVVWQLAEHGQGTAIEVPVDLPEAEAHRLAAQQDIIRGSLARLARLAEDPAAVT